MKIRLLLSLLLLFTSLLYSQDFKYGWLSDIHIGAPKADEDLEAVVDDINLRPEIKFVVATGDIAEKGMNQELETAKKILDKLNVPYFVLPGNHDTKWSESGLTKFADLWEDDKFVYQLEGTSHIGMKSGVAWRGGGGHFAIDDIQWLEDVLKNIDKKNEVYFYTHHPLDGDADNWFKVTNLLRDYNINGIFIGHGHSNRQLEFNGIPSAMGRSTLSRPKYAGYSMIEISTDSILLYEIKVDSIPRYWGGWQKNIERNIPLIDSLQFIKYSESVNILWDYELNTTLSAVLLADQGNIYSADTDGKVICFDLYGNIKWEYPTYGTIFSRPVRDKDVLAVGTIEGDLITLNANNGDILQTIGIGEAVTSQLITIEIEKKGIPSTGVVFGTASGSLYCYDIYSLEKIWENKSASLMIETKPLYVEGKIIFGSWDNYLFCIDAESGSLIWKWTENKNFYYSPAASWPVTDGKNVYVSTPDKFISAIDLLLGTTVWRKDDFKSWEAIGITNDKNQLLVKSFMDKFFIVDAKTGKVIHEVDIDFGLDTMPVQPIEWNGKFLFGAKDGNVYLVNEDGTWEALFFTGTARAHSVQHVENNIFAASNMDGKIFVFSLN